MQEILVVSDPETVRVLSDDERLRILAMIEQEGPLSASSIARSLKTSAPRICYHIKILEKHGLVQLAETQKRGNLVEKFYSAVARRIEVHMSSEGESSPARPRLRGKMANSLGDIIISEIEKFQDAESKGGHLSFQTLHLTIPDIKGAITAFLNRLLELERAGEASGAPGRVEIGVAIAAFEKDSGSELRPNLV